MKRLLLIALFALSVLVVPVCASADPVSCASSTVLRVSDVTLGDRTADDCYGTFSGNDSLGAVSGLWDGGWDAFVKDDQAPGTLAHEGLVWTLSAPQGQRSGAWTLTLGDDGPSEPLPVTFDLLAVLKAGDMWAAYLFTAETFSALGTRDGTFTVAFEKVNSKGHSSVPALSHMSLYVRQAEAVVPEPASLVLLGTGLAAVAAGARRRRLRKR